MYIYIYIHIQVLAERERERERESSIRTHTYISCPRLRCPCEGQGSQGKHAQRFLSPVFVRRVHERLLFAISQVSQRMTHCQHFVCLARVWMRCGQRYECFAIDRQFTEVHRHIWLRPPEGSWKRTNTISKGGRLWLRPPEGSRQRPHSLAEGGSTEPTSTARACNDA